MCIFIFSLSIQQLMETSLSAYLRYCEKCCNKHEVQKPLILFSFHSEVAMLNHMVVLFLIYRGTSTLFYIVTVEVYIHTNSV